MSTCLIRKTDLLFIGNTSEDLKDIKTDACLRLVIIAQAAAACCLLE